MEGLHITRPRTPNDALMPEILPTGARSPSSYKPVDAVAPPLTDARVLHHPRNLIVVLAQFASPGEPGSAYGPDFIARRMVVEGLEDPRRTILLPARLFEDRPGGQPKPGQGSNEAASAQKAQDSPNVPMRRGQKVLYERLLQMPRHLRPLVLGGNSWTCLASVGAQLVHYSEDIRVLYIRGEETHQGITSAGPGKGALSGPGGPSAAAGTTLQASGGRIDQAGMRSASPGQAAPVLVHMPPYALRALMRRERGVSFIEEDISHLPGIAVPAVLKDFGHGPGTTAPGVTPSQGQAGQGQAGASGSAQAPSSTSRQAEIPVPPVLRTDHVLLLDPVSGVHIPGPETRDEAEHPSHTTDEAVAKTLAYMQAEQARHPNAVWHVVLDVSAISPLECPCASRKTRGSGRASNTAGLATAESSAEAEEICGICRIKPGQAVVGFSVMQLLRVLMGIPGPMVSMDLLGFNPKCSLPEDVARSLDSVMPLVRVFAGLAGMQEVAATPLPPPPALSALSLATAVPEIEAILAATATPHGSIAVVQAGTSGVPLEGLAEGGPEEEGGAVGGGGIQGKPRLAPEWFDVGESDASAATGPQSSPSVPIHVLPVPVPMVSPPGGHGGMSHTPGTGTAVGQSEMPLPWHPASHRPTGSLCIDGKEAVYSPALALEHGGAHRDHCTKEGGRMALPAAEVNPAVSAVAAALGPAAAGLNLAPVLTPAQQAAVAAAIDSAASAGPTSSSVGSIGRSDSFSGGLGPRYAFSPSGVIASRSPPRTSPGQRQGSNLSPNRSPPGYSPASTPGTGYVSHAGSASGHASRHTVLVPVPVPLKAATVAALSIAGHHKLDPYAVAEALQAEQDQVLKEEDEGPSSTGSNGE